MKCIHLPMNNTTLNQIRKSYIKILLCNASTQLAMRSLCPRTGTSLCSLSRLSLPSRPHSLFLLDHYWTRPEISLCSRPRLSLPSRGLFLVRLQCAKTGLLHPILFLLILNLLWKLHGPLGPYYKCNMCNYTIKLIFILHTQRQSAKGIKNQIMQLTRACSQLWQTNLGTDQFHNYLCYAQIKCKIMNSVLLL